jgi:uncharacterized protein YodC (DUF2158 family)
MKCAVDFEVGQIVKNKTPNSPAMFIEAIRVTVAQSVEAEYHCIWFDGLTTHKAVFVRTALEEIDA